MDRKPAMTLVEVVIVIIALALLGCILVPFVTRKKEITSYDRCQYNVIGMGKAMSMYLGDYNDQFPWMKTNNEWNAATGSSYDRRPDANTNCNVTALLFMLVRKAGQSPRLFICPRTADTVDPNVKDANGRYHFDFTPFYVVGQECVSYSYQTPVMDSKGQWRPMIGYPAVDANGNWIEQTKYDSMPIIADRTPTYSGGNACFDWMSGKGDANSGMSANHGGQTAFVLYADQHCGQITRADAGVNNDNIYSCAAVKPGQDANIVTDQGSGTLDIQQHRSMYDSFLLGPKKMASKEE